MLHSSWTKDNARPCVISSDTPSDASWLRTGVQSAEEDRLRAWGFAGYGVEVGRDYSPLADFQGSDWAP